jgi:hypothetical protein
MVIDLAYFEGVKVKIQISDCENKDYIWFGNIINIHSKADWILGRGGRLVWMCRS